jgi:diguanylate cyclase (GGDEF)-like protein/PAS domain S-box-containing protein
MIPASAQTAASHSTRPYPLVRLVVATALLILVLIAATSAVLFVSYQDTLRQQKTNLRNLSIAFSAQTFSVAQAVENVMLQAERGHAANDPSAPAANSLARFEGNRTTQEYLLGIHLYDNDGQLVASGVMAKAKAAVRPSASEIRSAIDGKPDALRISITNIDPITGRGVINFMRPAVDASGKRTGTILAQADSSCFGRIYSVVELGKGGSVTLFNRNGTMLVRGPDFPEGIGRSFSDTPLFKQYLSVSDRNAFAAASPLDGKERLYGYDAVSNYPLVIITGMDRSDALASWYGRVWTALISLALISMTVIFLAWRVARDAARQSSLIGKLAASEARAEKSADYLAAILNAVGTPIWVLDSARKIVMLNQAFSRFAGRGAAELVGQPEKDALDPDNAGERDRRYRELLHGAQSTEAITEIQDGSGEPRTVIQLTSKLLDETGQAQIVSVLTDITERQKTERRLTYIANYDLLTGLPNQGQFRRMLEAELANAAVRGACVGTLVVSLERVQEITDLLGHEAGDSALRQIGDVFQSLLPGAKGVARIKSNEFAVMIEADKGRDFLEQYAIELHQRLSGALRVGEREFYLGPVIGVSIFPEDGGNADELVRRADSALNRTGVDINDTIHFFSERAQTDLDERLTVEAQLRRALERAEFRLLYQPKIEIQSGRIVGFEALLRWSNPVLGEVSPVRFIPIAERTGLIIQIGAWALQEACRQIHSWNQAGIHVKVAVNLAPRQFYQKDLLAMIRQCVESSAIQASSLELEITENALMSREQEVDALMREIRALGIELSIDDFGTGYSSLAYLKRFPVQRLKVDRAFIRDLGKDGDSAAIVRSIVNLAHGLKLRVVAEGVETEQQLAILRSMSCDEYQGFLFSRPVDADAVLSMFAQNSSDVA